MNLRRFLPIDPDYAPFGWRWLRGLNVLAFAVWAPYVLSRGLVYLRENIAFRDPDAKTLGVAFVEGIVRSPWNFVIGLSTAVVFMIITVTVINLTARAPARWRIAALGAAMLGAALAAAAMRWRVDVVTGYIRQMPWTLQRTGARILDVFVVGCLSAAPIYLRKQRQERIRTLRDAKLRRIDAEGQEAAARLQSLQAQIEPHFLFNTLAHVVRLHQVDAERGRRMLRGLTDYLRSALPQVRCDDFTLARELALTRSYVEVQQIRMGERLRVEFDVPVALLGARVPAMTVLTLAENAVKHGLGPRSEGGMLRIEASLSGDMLEIAVSDDGLGLQLGAGSGHGLSNIRSRLLAAHGSRARFEIGNRPVGGVRAVISLPFEPLFEQETAQ